MTQRIDEQQGKNDQVLEKRATYGHDINAGIAVEARSTIPLFAFVET